MFMNQNEPYLLFCIFLNTFFFSYDNFQLLKSCDIEIDIHVEKMYLKKIFEIFDILYLVF